MYKHLSRISEKNLSPIRGRAAKCRLERFDFFWQPYGVHKQITLVA